MLVRGVRGKSLLRRLLSLVYCPLDFSAEADARAGERADRRGHGQRAEPRQPGGGG